MDICCRDMQDFLFAKSIIAYGLMYNRKKSSIVKFFLIYFVSHCCFSGGFVECADVSAGCSCGPVGTKWVGYGYAFSRALVGAVDAFPVVHAGIGIWCGMSCRPFWLRFFGIAVFEVLSATLEGRIHDIQLRQFPISAPHIRPHTFILYPHPQRNGRMGHCKHSCTNNAPIGYRQTPD